MPAQLSQEPVIFLHFLWNEIPVVANCTEVSWAPQRRQQGSLWYPGMMSLSFTHLSSDTHILEVSIFMSPEGLMLVGGCVALLIISVLPFKYFLTQQLQRGTAEYKHIRNVLM